MDSRKQEGRNELMAIFATIQNDLWNKSIHSVEIKA